ncbi:MAG: AI-2E family transporter [Bacteroidota bacterium]|nr:AI-2E family transporter [Bacteroidota bacterium]MDP4234301.1 AI-2E family transporter [Bacteroidota bacterium]MDP4243235.1 AI-2E family transporter [Bacteroidota bacterium]MDP4288058.1 AI-2E family transporter [Bacteroidota bacterium]
MNDSIRSAPRSITIPLTILALVATGASLHIMQPVLLPLVVALFLANLFRPMVKFLLSHRVPMALALIAVMIVVGGILMAVGLVAISSLQSLIAAMPRYAVRWDHDILPSLMRLLDDAPAALQDQVRTLEWSKIVQVSAILGVLYAGAGGFVSVLSGVGLILLFMLFILGGYGLFERKIRVAYPEHATNLAEVIKRIDAKTERYFITVTLMNFISGLLTFVILAIFGVDLALLWGLITFLVNFIPTIGSIFALVLPVTVAFLQFANPGTPLAMAITLIIVQFIWGSVVTPRLMGARLDLSPLLVLISLIFWGWVWGPWGMILSVPITSMIKIALESVPATKPIAVLMSSKT